MKVLTQTANIYTSVGKRTNGKSRLPEEQADYSETNQNKKTGILLTRAKNGDKKAQEELVRCFQAYISARAQITCNQSFKWLSKEELEREGEFRIARMIPKYNPTFHHAPHSYLTASIKNGMIDYTRGEAPVHAPISSLPLDRNGKYCDPQMIADPYAEDVNKFTPSPELEDLEELLNSPEAKSILRENDAGRRIVELNLGIDLGSNPNRAQKSFEEIAESLGINVAAAHMRKSRFIQKLRTLAQEKYLDIFN